MRRPPSSVCAAVAITLAVLPACGRFARTGSGDVIATIQPTSYKPDVKLPPITKYEDFREGRKGLLHVRLLDEKNHPVAGAYIRYKGSDTGQAATDRRGVIEVLVQPGTYKVDVAPCGPAVVTEDYQDALASVVAGGQPSQGQLSGIRWKRRFYPAPSVSYSSSPPWQIGETVRASVRIEDRCPTSYGGARRASLPTFGWRPSSHYRFAAKPVMRSDADAKIHISFRCVSRGDGSITIYDAGRVEPPLDILEAGPGPASGKRFCER